MRLTLVILACVVGLLILGLLLFTRHVNLEFDREFWSRYEDW